MFAAAIGCERAPAGVAATPVEGEFVGETAQGLRFVADVRDGRITFALVANCSLVGFPHQARPRPVLFDGEEFQGPVLDDGTYSISEELTRDGGGGAERIEVDIRGHVRSGVRGEFEIDSHLYDDMGGESWGTCSSGRVGFKATDRRAALTPVVRAGVPNAELLVPSSDAMWVFDEQSDSAKRTFELIKLSKDGAVELRLFPESRTGDTNRERVVPDGAGGVWFLGSVLEGEGVHPALIRYDGSSGAVVATRRMAGAVRGPAFGHGSLWALSVLPDPAGTGPPPRLLERLDPGSGATVASARVPIAGRVTAFPAGLAISNYDEEIMLVDPANLKASTTGDHGRTWSGAAGGASGLWLWTEEHHVRHIGPDGAEVATTKLPSLIGDIAVDATGAWVSNPHERVLRRIEDGRVVKVIDVDEALAYLALGADGRLWATTATGVVAYDVSG